MADVVGRAAAGRSMVNRSAFSIGSASVRHDARVLAPLADACFVQRAVLVVDASQDAVVVLADVPERTLAVDRAFDLGRLLVALYPRVTLVGNRARADGLVVPWLAVGVSSAGQEDAARILTTSVDAGLREQAIRILSAADDALGVVADVTRQAVSIRPADVLVDDDAPVERVARMVVRTDADRSMVLRLAFGLVSAYARYRARILAFGSDACLVLRTLSVVAAARNALSVMAVLSDQTLAVVLASFGCHTV